MRGDSGWAGDSPAPFKRGLGDDKSKLLAARAKTGKEHGAANKALAHMFLKKQSARMTGPYRGGSVHGATGKFDHRRAMPRSSIINEFRGASSKDDSSVPPLII